MIEEKNKNETENEIKSTDEEKDEFLIVKYWPYLFMFIILLFFCVFGITYSIYKGDGSSDNEIITDQIIFSYSEVDKVGNGILIQNAVPISDAMGKVLVGKNQYFDFYVTATTSSKKVHYQLLLNKDEASTLSNENVRVYLTQTLGGYENALILTNFSDLKTKDINNKMYYVLYEKTLPEKLENFNESFRLRMWVGQNATNYENQEFSLKVDVYAEQVEE